MAMDISEGADCLLRPRLALLGGAFNPVHRGHLVLAKEVQAKLDVEGILFIPTGHPPHKDLPEVSCEERQKMLDLAIGATPGWRSSDVECRMAGPSYTARTISTLAITPLPFFIMGDDAFVDFWEWGEPEVILRGAHVVVVTRPGSTAPGVREGFMTVLRASGPFDPKMTRRGIDGVLEGHVREVVWSLPHFGTTLRYLRIEALSVSSTELRNGLAGKERDHWLELLPDAVKSYIVEKGIYLARPKSDDRFP